MAEYEIDPDEIRGMGESGKKISVEKSTDPAANEIGIRNYSFFRKARLTNQEIEEFVEMGIELRRFAHKMA